MSAIAGFMSFDGSHDTPAMTRAMTSRMQSRGPDGIDHWSSEKVTLGQCLLQEGPEIDSDTPPVVDRGSGCVLVWDGRLDNREDLFGVLKPQLDRQDAPDSDYVLAAHAKWGADCARHLLGDFAFAIWNPKQKTLFAARDVMGGAYLAFVKNERFFAFASDWEALIGLPGVSAAPNELYIAHLLFRSFKNAGDRKTWQRDVQTIKGGESLIVSIDGTLRVSQFRKLAASASLKYRSDEECKEHFLEIFGKSIHCRLRTGSLPALMMSGGLDTAGIAAMLTRLRQPGDQQFASYSALSDTPLDDPESRSILELGKLSAIAPRHVLVPSLNGPVEAVDLVETAWEHAHPVDNWLLIQSLMCLAASREGKRFMLQGGSGDITLNTPQNYMVSDLRRGRIIRAWRECRSASQHHVYLLGVSPARTFAANAYNAYLPRLIRSPINRLRRKKASNVDFDNLLNPDFIRRIQLERLVHDQNDKSLSEADTLSGMIGSAMTACGRVGGRYGLKLRDPWADQRVVEFFLGLPMRFKVRDGWTKYLVRTAFNTELPGSIRWRTDKTHLGPLVTERLMHESREYVDCMLREEMSLVEEFVDVPAAQAMYERYLMSSEPLLRDKVFELVTMLSWLKRVNSMVSRTRF